MSCLSSFQVVNVLRSQLTKLEEMKKERETLEGEIKAVTFDMSTAFLTALAQDGAINEEQLSLSQLDQLYGAYNQRVQATLRTQEELLGQVQVYKRTQGGLLLKRHFLNRFACQQYAALLIDSEPFNSSKGVVCSYSKI